MLFIASSKLSNSPFATKATIAAPNEHASWVWMRFTGRPKVSASIWQARSLFEPPPPTYSCFMCFLPRFSMLFMDM